MKNLHVNKPVFFAFLTVATISLLVSLLTFIKPPKASSDSDSDTSPKADLEKNYPIVIIDAGHGGKDGGAISVTGSTEKELNLSLSKTVRDILELLGYNVIMTRETDTELTHTSGGTRKMQDLKGRLTVSTENPTVPFVSIHMNKFTDERYSGLQVYYSPNAAQSLDMAESVREFVTSYVQQSNDRKCKKANSSIYLLNKITSPSILIECGFLSNKSEAEMLDDEEYRATLGIVIACSLDSWYNSYETSKG
jgi:N-acetylmuramoyl-L-alanine amidase